MIVAVTGAYRNCGDHLIGSRAISLVRRFLDEDVVVLDRKRITSTDYPIMNAARIILLTGGPAYQRNIYPGVYSIDLDRLARPVVPFGLGWKAPLGTSPTAFEFRPSSLEFIRRIHSAIGASSARDPLTIEVLSHVGVSNVDMTGCPAWYDLQTIGEGYEFQPEVTSLVLSTPSRMRPELPLLMKWLNDRFPKAKKTLAFHHGIVPGFDKESRNRAMSFSRLAFGSILRQWRVSSLAGSLAKMEDLYSQADLHIGYRVHAHLLCLSQRTASILINEDVRGVGQSYALQSPAITIHDGKDLDSVTSAVESHFETRGKGVARSVEVMRATFPDMLNFLNELK